MRYFIERGYTRAFQNLILTKIDEAEGLKTSDLYKCLENRIWPDAWIVPIPSGNESSRLKEMGIDNYRAIDPLELVKIIKTELFWHNRIRFKLRDLLNDGLIGKKENIRNAPYYITSKGEACLLNNPLLWPPDAAELEQAIVIEDRADVRKQIGEIGEKLAYNWLLSEHPASQGYRIEWISQSKPYSPFDILLVLPDGVEIYYEVKTTIRPIGSSIDISDAEVLFRRKYPYNHFIVIQYLDCGNWDRLVDRKIVYGDETVELIPTSYRLSIPFD